MATKNTIKFNVYKSNIHFYVNHNGQKLQLPFCSMIHGEHRIQVVKEHCVRLLKLQKQELSTLKLEISTSDKSYEIPDNTCIKHFHNNNIVKLIDVITKCDNKCAICLCKVINNDLDIPRQWPINYYRTTCCGNYLHGQCADRYLVTNSACPYCKSNHIQLIQHFIGNSNSYQLIFPKKQRFIYRPNINEDAQSMSFVIAQFLHCCYPFFMFLCAVHLIL